MFWVPYGALTYTSNILWCCDSFTEVISYFPKSCFKIYVTFVKIENCSLNNITTLFFWSVAILVLLKRIIWDLGQVGVFIIDIISWRSFTKINYFLKHWGLFQDKNWSGLQKHICTSTVNREVLFSEIKTVNFYISEVKRWSLINV
jgi:hypothetical protein